MLRVLWMVWLLRVSGQIWAAEPGFQVWHSLRDTQGLT
jgi:hypothetical protein